MGGEGDFWERNAGIYDTGIDYVLGNNLRPIVLAMLGKEQPLGKTVEIGCGTGYFTPLLAQLSDHVVATDISEAMLNQAQERVKGLPKVSVQREDAEKTSFPDMSFDTAFLGLIFQLVDGPKALAEMHRILKPKGVLILAIPTMDGLRFVDKIRGVLRNYQVYRTIKPLVQGFIRAGRSLPSLRRQDSISSRSSRLLIPIILADFQAFIFRQ